MAELRTEEEQLEAIKRWWKENGTALIAGVAIAIAGVVGWNAWQNYQENQSASASMRYQHLVNLTDSGEIDEARSLVAEITDNHGRTLYADLARLIDARLARLQVAAGDAEAALDTLARDIPAALAAQQADVRGDALQHLGRTDEARQAWQEALAVAEQRNQPIYGVQLKLDDLGAEEATL